MFNKIGLYVGLKIFFRPMRLLDLVVEFVLKIVLSELIVQCVIIILKMVFIHYLCIFLYLLFIFCYFTINKTLKSTKI
jgi:hypothetical protein